MQEISKILKLKLKTLNTQKIDNSNPNLNLLVFLREYVWSWLQLYNHDYVINYVLYLVFNEDDKAMFFSNITFFQIEGRVLTQVKEMNL